MAMIEKAMYIKGLCDGLDLDKTTKEGKLLAALLDVVSDLAAEIDDMQSKMSDLEDYCEELDEDLGDVEEVLLDLDDEDYFDDEDEFDGCDGNFAACDCECDFDDEEWDEEIIYDIVGSTEADPMTNKISDQSPIGMADRKSVV